MALFAPAELRALLGSLFELHAAPNMRSMTDRLLDVTSQATARDPCFLARWDDGRRLLLWNSQPTLFTKDAIRALEARGPEHPLVDHFRKNPDSPPLAISDLTSLRDFEKTRLFREHFQPLGMRDQLCACLCGPEPLILVGGYQKTWGVRPRCAERLRLVLPQLALAYERIAGDAVCGLPPDASPATRAAAAALPVRLRQALHLVMVGMITAEIAEKMTLSRYSIQDYLADLYRRFDVSGRSELMALHARKAAAAA